MTRKFLATTFASILGTATVSADVEYYPVSVAEPAIVTMPSTDHRPGFTMTVDYDLRGACGLSYECIILALKPHGHGGLKPLRTSLTSSYGQFRIFLADLTGDGVEEIVTMTGEGSGTSARVEYLVVYQWAGSTLQQLLRTEVSEFFGPMEMWRYEPRFARDVDTQRIRLSLELRHDPPTDNPLTVPDLIPKLQHIVFEYDAPTQTLRASR